MFYILERLKVRQKDVDCDFRKRSLWVVFWLTFPPQNDIMEGLIIKNNLHLKQLWVGGLHYLGRYLQLWVQF